MAGSSGYDEQYGYNADSANALDGAPVGNEQCTMDRAYFYNVKCAMDVDPVYDEQNAIDGAPMHNEQYARRGTPVNNEPCEYLGEYESLHLFPSPETSMFDNGGFHNSQNAWLSQYTNWSSGDHALGGSSLSQVTEPSSATTAQSIHHDSLGSAISPREDQLWSYPQQYIFNTSASRDQRPVVGSSRNAVQDQARPPWHVPVTMYPTSSSFDTMIPAQDPAIGEQQVGTSNALLQPGTTAMHTNGSSSALPVGLNLDTGLHAVLSTCMANRERKGLAPISAEDRKKLSEVSGYEISDIENWFAQRNYTAGLQTLCNGESGTLNRSEEDFRDFSSRTVADDVGESDSEARISKRIKQYQKSARKKCCRQHPASARSGGVLGCPLKGCKALFTGKDKVTWERHWKRIESDTYYQCSVCEKMDVRLHRIVDHRKKEHPTLPSRGQRYLKISNPQTLWVCGFCGASFDTWKEYLRKHVFEHLIKKEYTMDQWNEKRRWKQPRNRRKSRPESCNAATSNAGSDDSDSDSSDAEDPDSKGTSRSKRDNRKTPQRRKQQPDKDGEGYSHSSSKSSGVLQKHQAEHDSVQVGKWTMGLVHNFSNHSHETCGFDLKSTNEAPSQEILYTYHLMDLDLEGISSWVDEDEVLSCTASTMLFDELESSQDASKDEDYVASEEEQTFNKTRPVTDSMFQRHCEGFGAPNGKDFLERKSSSEKPMSMRKQQPNFIDIVKISSAFFSDKRLSACFQQHRRNVIIKECAYWASPGHILETRGQFFIAQLTLTFDRTRALDKIAPPATTCAEEGLSSISMTNIQHLCAQGIIFAQGMIRKRWMCSVMTFVQTYY